MNIKSNARILVIEDNPANLELFLDILESNGYVCFFAMAGSEALEIAKREIPDLILLDIQLPGMDGLEVLRALRSMPETKHIKTVALTAYAMKGDRERFQEATFDGYIAKPIGVKEFSEAVKGFLQSAD